MTKINFFYWFKAGVLICILAFQSGCSVGPYGSLASKVTYTQSAMVVEVYSLGIHLRPGGFDGGASLGHRQAVYIFPCSLKEFREKGAGWHWFYVPVPDGVPLTRAVSSYGLEMETTPHQRRVSLGYSDQIETIGPEPGESILARVFFDREYPEKTHVFLKEKLDEPQISLCR